MADRVSWLVIEPGWEVVDSSGESLGKVQETVGDTGDDIFNGLAVTPGLLRPPRYVPAEVVGEIEDGRVHLTISQQEFDRLDDHEEPPPSEQFRPA
jgi:sporulation protein YlmC with PRC-barrel domain